MATRALAAKPFNHVISLGTVCYASWMIKQLGLKRRSYPFDWIFSSPAMVLDILQDDFRCFLDPVHYRANPVESRPHPSEHIAEHLHYRATFGVEHVFSHRDVTTPDNRAYYERCVDRFRSALAAPNPTLLLMINPGDRLATLEVFTGLADWASRNAPYAVLSVINLRRATDGQPMFSTTAERGPHALIEYFSASGIRGLDFAKPVDDLNLREWLRSYEFEPL
jgi:hypothetical protein